MHIDYNTELTKPERVRKYIKLGGGIEAAVTIMHDVWDDVDKYQNEKKRKRKQQKAARRRNRKK